MDEILKNSIKKIENNEVTKEAVYMFLCAYYDDYIGEISKGDDASFPEELTMPLEERNSGVFEAISWLAGNEFDMNEGDFNPLMMAVAFADAPMTEFLISKGADANYWPDMDEEPYRGNYYLEDIDIAYLNEAWPRDERYINALLQTAKVLLVEGHVGSFGGLCFATDTEKRIIHLARKDYKY